MINNHTISSCCWRVWSFDTFYIAIMTSEIHYCQIIQQVFSFKIWIQKEGSIVSHPVLDVLRQCTVKTVTKEKLQRRWRRDEYESKINNNKYVDNNIKSRVIRILRTYYWERKEGNFFASSFSVFSSWYIILAPIGLLCRSCRLGVASSHQHQKK